MRCIRECLARCARASIRGMSKMWWLAFGAVAAILLCLFYFGGVWTAALLVVVVVVGFLGWKFVAPLFGPGIEQSAAKRKAGEEEARGKLASRE